MTGVKLGDVKSWFESVGIGVTEVPSRVVVECLRPAAMPNGRLRPSISFDPASPESVARAKQAALSHCVSSRICGEFGVCELPCGMRRLESEEADKLMEVFRRGNIVE